jgi:integrase/recombinase XerC
MKHPLSIADIARALAASTGETRVIVEVLYAAGPRVSEVVKLRWADVNLAGREVRLQGKGGDERAVCLGLPCVKALTGLVTARGGLVAPNERVFPGLTAQNVRDRLKTLGRRVGVHLTPHLFRHAFATHMLDRGADIRSVQEMMGHRKVSTTTDVYWDHSEVALHQVNRLIVTCLPRARAYLMAHPESFVDSYPYRASP